MCHSSTSLPTYPLSLNHRCKCDNALILLPSITCTIGGRTPNARNAEHFVLTGPGRYHHPPPILLANPATRSTSLTFFFPTSLSTFL